VLLVVWLVAAVGVLVAVTRIAPVGKQAAPAQVVTREVPASPSVAPAPPVARTPPPTNPVPAVSTPDTRAAEAAPTIPPEAPPGTPAWRRYAVAPPPVDGRPMIAVVLDDVGVVRRNADLAMALDPPVTLAFMSYANGVGEMVAEARARGHEIMMHVPMEPLDRSEDPGPNALLAGLPADELARRIAWHLSRFDGYVGINNHMGSRFTADAPGMGQVMAALKARGLLFVDSRTSPQSVGVDTARSAGVPAASRDVFLDNELDAREIGARLADLEHRARQHGAAIGIGHPHPETVAALRRWLPEARARGFVIVPVSTIVARGLTG
jgi:polysaccharide deacetylase 2 family uncharacterized protein YibQ